MDDIKSNILSEIGSAITGLFSFGKSPDKANYDSYRATVWDTFARLVDSVTVYRQQGLLDRNGLQAYIDAVTKIMADFKTSTDQMYIPKIGSSWVTPRFNDYYTFMNNEVNKWRNEMLTLPATSIFDTITGGSTTPPPTTYPGSNTGTGNTGNVSEALWSNPMVIIGLAVGAAMLLGSKQHR